MEGRSIVRRTTPPLPLPTTTKPLKTERFSPRLSRPPHLESPALAHKRMRQWKKGNGSRDREGTSSVDYELMFDNLSEKRITHEIEQAFLEMKSKGFVFDIATMSSMMLCYAENGFLSEARGVWDEVLASSLPPFEVAVVSRMFDAYGRMGRLEEVVEFVDELRLRGFKCLFPKVYALAVSCLGRGGRLDLMECVLRKMVEQGYAVDSVTGNAFVKYYSLYGSLKEMENAYARLKSSRCLIEEEGIRAVSFAYLKEKKFYKLGEFLRDVGLGRRNSGNLLWNLLLLSYAANFKMKSLQREFLSMLGAGFRPDVTTFNIRMLAFSKMSMMWDLHLSLEHMKVEMVAPDLVTYGCVVDAYLGRRLGKNLDFALDKMNKDESPVVQTDPFVYLVLGKGDFHMSAEAFMEYTMHKKWTYRDLVAIYLRKQYRRDQVFWNY